MIHYFETEEGSHLTNSDKIWEALGPYTKTDLENVLLTVQERLDHWDELYEDDEA